MEGIYNLRSPAVKRLMREAEELKSPTEEYYAQPLNDNLFEWHFTVRGPPKTEFDGGVYHGRITLPADYPMKPPSIILLTPNGRFEVNKKICLSISGHHPESWQPSWSIRTALLAIIGFMPTHGNGALGSLDYSLEERITLAQKSHFWVCSECGLIKKLLQNGSLFDCNVLGKHERMNIEVSKQGENGMTNSTTVNSAAEDEDITNEEPNLFKDDSSQSQLFQEMQHFMGEPDNNSRQRLLLQFNDPVSTPTLSEPISLEGPPLIYHALITACIWVIVCLLTILLLRRLFLI